MKEQELENRLGEWNRHPRYVYKLYTDTLYLA